MDLTFVLLAIGQIFEPTTIAYALAALGLTVQFGYTGLLNFGQAGFMAIGGYAFAILTLKSGMPFPVAVLAAIAGAALFAVVLGVPPLRLRTDYLAIVTIAAAEIVRYTVQTPDLIAVTGGSDGLNGAGSTFNAFNPIPAGNYGTGALTYSSTDLWIRIVGWTFVIVVTLLVRQLMRSPWGRVIKGIREDEDAVRSLGKNVFSYKMQSLVIGGCFGALSGILFVLPRAVQADSLGRPVTFYAWTILLLGGAATVFGPVLGSVLLFTIL